MGRFYDWLNQITSYNVAFQLVLARPSHRKAATRPAHFQKPWGREQTSKGLESPSE